MADRWHLLRNLGAAVQALADRHGAAARRAAQPAGDEPAAATPDASPPAPPALRGPSAAERASRASLARRQARYEEAARLHADGLSLSRIAALLGADRKTVRRWLRRGHAPLWTKPRRGGVLDAGACPRAGLRPDPWAAHLDRCWAEGCRNAAQLWRELAAIGFPGRPATVRAWATRRRKGEPAAAVSVAGARAAAKQPPPTSQVARWLMADTDATRTRALAEAERGFVARLLAQAPGLADAVAVAKRLNRLLRREGEGDLGKLLEDAAGTPLSEFAAGLKRDFAAVQAALDTPSLSLPGPPAPPRVRSTASRPSSGPCTAAPASRSCAPAS